MSDSPAAPRFRNLNGKVCWRRLRWRERRERTIRFRCCSRYYARLPVRDASVRTACGAAMNVALKRHPARRNCQILRRQLRALEHVCWPLPGTFRARRCVRNWRARARRLARQHALPLSPSFPLSVIVPKGKRSFLVDSRTPTQT